MLTGLFRAKESILYAIVTIFLLERVRRGWNRVAERGKQTNLAVAAIESKQQTFMFVAALLYALPFVLPIVRYIYRSFDELSHYVGGISALSNVWAFAGIVLLVELFLAVVIYNLLGIYVERMNAALGFFRQIGRSVVDGSKVVAQAGPRVARGMRGVVVESVRTGRSIVAASVSFLRRSHWRIRPALRRLAPLPRHGSR